MFLWLMQLYQTIRPNHNAKFIKQTCTQFGFRNEFIYEPNESEELILIISNKILQEYKINSNWKNVQHKRSISKLNTSMHYWQNGTLSIAISETQNDVCVIVNSVYEILAKWVIIKNSNSIPIYQDIYVSKYFNSSICALFLSSE